MKSHHSTSRLAKCIALTLGLAAASYLAPTTQAATGNWKNTGSDWTTNANWSGATYPGTSTSDNATFLSAASVVNPDLATSVSINTLSIDNSGVGGSYSITTANGSTLTIGATSSSIVITGGGTTNIAPQVIFAGSRVINNGTTALNFNGGIGLNGTGPTLTLTNTTAITTTGITTLNGTGATVDLLTFTGTGSMTVSGSIAPGAGTAVVTLASTQTYSGTLALNGANTFNATTTWRAGTLLLGNNAALGGQNLNIGSSTSGALAVSVLTTGAFTISNNIAATSGSVNTSFTVGGSQTTGTSTYQGTVNLANFTAASNGLNVTSALGGTVDFTGIISGTNTGSFITKVGAGVVRFSGVNTYTGTTTVSVGTLLVNTPANPTNSGTGTGSVSVNAGTLGGTGILRPGNTNATITVSSGAFLAPGDSTTGNGIGTLALNGSNTTGTLLTLAIGAKMSFQLGSGLASDKLNFWNYAAGDFAINSNVIDITMLAGSTTGIYNLFNFYSGDGSGAANSGISSGLSVNFLNGAAGNLVYNTSSIDLNITTIPEPATWALLAFSLTTVMVLRRRRKS